jgi:hypothetical protein
MTLASLNCPSCGAPLGFGDRQTRGLCLYCGSTVALDVNGKAPQPQTAIELAPEVMDTLKQLIVDGRQLEAIQLYRQRTGASEAEAAETLAGLIRDLTRRTLVQQPISNFGLVVVGIVDLIAAAFLLWGFSNENGLAIGLGAALLAIESLATAAAVWARMVEVLGTPAPAVVRRFARIGELKLRGEPEPVLVARLWLEVRPNGQPPFLAEKNIVIRQRSLARLEPGLMIEVRYLRSGQVVPATPLKVLAEA